MVLCDATQMIIQECESALAMVVLRAKGIELSRLWQYHANLE